MTASDSGSFVWIRVLSQVYMYVCMYTLCRVALYEWLTEMAYGIDSLGHACHACLHDRPGRSRHSRWVLKKSLRMDDGQGNESETKRQRGRQVWAIPRSSRGPFHVESTDGKEKGMAPCQPSRGDKVQRKRLMARAGVT